MIPCKILSPGGKLPTRKNPSDAGFDLYAAEPTTLPPFIYQLHDLVLHSEPVKVRTGIAIELPPFAFGQIVSRSGLGSKGILVVTGTVDSGYRGEIMVCLLNTQNEPYQIDAGDRIAQMLILQAPKASVRFIEASSLALSDRGLSGFGSSGK